MIAVSEISAANWPEYQPLIERLAGNLTPVRRLIPPWQRALIWLLCVAILAAALTTIANLPALELRFAMAPDLAIAAAGSTMTAIAATFAAFQSAIPGRSARWSLLPLPPLLVWLGASGFGCLRSWIIPGIATIEPAEMKSCFGFILLLSVPLSVLTILLLRRTWPVRPALTAALAGLAVAAAAASLLNLFHPYDASAADLAVHIVAVLIVVCANRLLAGRFFAPDRLHIERR